MSEPRLLIGDIGGTNARFALASPDGPGYERVLALQCADFETAELAIAAYLEETGTTQPAVICLAAAGPIVDHKVRFTNNHWTLESAALAESFESAQVCLMNDFEAIACSLPFLRAEEVTRIGSPEPRLQGREQFNVAVLGPGTGLGCAGLIGRGGDIYPVVGEGSHVGFAPENPLQLEVLKLLRERFERVSDERLLSGPGLENIYWAVRGIHGERGRRSNAAEIFERALANSDRFAAEALQLFFEALGQVAGNLALMLGAYDGVYIAGGIVTRYPDLLRASSFRAGFENKGRHRSLMETIPTLLVLHPQAGLLGASYRAGRMLQGLRQRRA